MARPPQSLPFRAWLDAWGAQRDRLLLAVSVSLSLGLLTLVWSFTWQRLASEKALTRANAQVQQQNLTAIISENLTQVLDLRWHDEVGRMAATLAGMTRRVHWRWAMPLPGLVFPAIHPPRRDGKAAIP